MAPTSELAFDARHRPIELYVYTVPMSKQDIHEANCLPGLHPEHIAPACELTWDARVELLTWVGAKACADVWHLHVLEGRLHLWQVVEPDSLAAQAFAKVYGERLADRLGIDLLAISVCDDRRAS